MRDRDRWWWLLLLVGLMFCAGSVFVPDLFLRSMPVGDPYMTAADYQQDIGITAFLALSLLGSGVTFVVMAMQGRTRHRRRLAALRGDAHALPLANMRVDVSLAPDVMEKPLELLWRASGKTKLTQGPLLLLQCLATLVSIAGVLLALLGPIFLPPQRSAEDLLQNTPPQSMNVPEMVLRIGITVLIVAALATLGVVIARAAPYLFGRPFGLSVTSSGIDARTELGSRIHISWDEMRLLEVSKGNVKVSRRFALYAEGKRIAWSEYGTVLGSDYVAVWSNAGELALRQVELLSLIAVRTGLVPRTLARAMQSSPEPARRAPRHLSTFLLFLVFALMLAGITAAAALYPVTPFLWVNWASTGSLALVAITIIVMGVVAALARTTVPPQASPPSVGAPSVEAAGVAYVMSWKMPPVMRLSILAIGVCLSVNLIPGAWVVIFQFFPTLFGSSSQLFSSDIFAGLGRYMLGWILGAFGVAAVGLVYRAFSDATTRIRADKDGLTVTSGRRRHFLAWSGVQEISFGPGSRGQFSYLVKSDVPTFQIRWAAGPQVVAASPPSDGSIPIGPDELAALVAARAGRQIRIRA